MTRKKFFSLILRIGISALALFFILRQVDFPQIVSSINKAKVVFLVFSFVFILANYVFSSLRWKILAAAKNIQATLLKFVKLYFVGAFFNNFLPTSVGGDVVKAYQLTKETDRKVDAVSCTFMERLAGVTALLLISWGGFLYYFKLKAALISIGLMILGSLGVWLAPKISKIHPLAEKFYLSVVSYRHGKEAVIKALGISFIVQAFSITTQYFVLLALGIDVSYFYALFVIPLINLASMAPISINGLGVQDGLYVFFFERVGAVPAEVLAASFVYHVLRLASSLIGGVLYVI
jgi:uncharacterized membrane protein YbhN (UPF0104 family)